MSDSNSVQDRWTLRRVAKRSVQVLREEGLRSVVFRILGETVYRRVILLERPLDLPVLPVSANAHLEVRMIVRTVSQEYLDFRKDTRAATVCRRLEAGHWCTTAHYDGRLAYVRWAGVGDVFEHYLGCYFKMAPDEVYVYDLFVAPEFRGRNIATAVGSEIYQYLRDAGYRRTVTVIIPETKVSLRVAQKLGNRVIGKAGYYRLGPWKRPFCRSVGNSVAPKISLANLDVDE